MVKCQDTVWEWFAKHYRRYGTVAPLMFGTLLVNIAVRNAVERPVAFATVHRLPTLLRCGGTGATLLDLLLRVFDQIPSLYVATVLVLLCLSPFASPDGSE